jgi:hypothetical protein
MASIRIVPSEIADVYRLAAHLREGDRLEISGLDLDPTAIIRASYRSAILRRTAFVDGELAAMWGLGGVALSDDGTPWLMTTKAVERIPVSFVRIARDEVRQMLALRRHLENVVLASYRSACRFLEVLGFALDEPVALGPQGLAYRRFWIDRKES